MVIFLTFHKMVCVPILKVSAVGIDRILNTDFYTKSSITKEITRELLIGDHRHGHAHTLFLPRCTSRWHNLPHIFKKPNHPSECNYVIIAFILSVELDITSLYCLDDAYNHDTYRPMVVDI